MGKKGLSWDEKRAKILEIYYEKKEPFNLKEIEKLGAKKGVVFQTIKDVNQSLVDDNLVETDRIGSGAFFWALPSKGQQSRLNLISNVEKHTGELEQQIADVLAKVEMEKSLREPLDGERDAMLAELAELQQVNAHLTEKLRVYEKCDPERMKELQAKQKVCREGMVRWTDNLYEMEGWMKKNNPGISGDELYKQFPILDNLDYLE